jgi:hypothetical protein
MIGSKLSLNCRVLIALGVLTGVMLVVFSGLATWAWLRTAGLGVAAALVVCGTCWISGLIALSAPLLFRDPQGAAQGILFGMLFRMGMPLLLVVVLVQSESVLLRAHVMEMLVGVYLTGLLVETLLSWWIAETSMGAAAPGMAKAS